MKGGRQIARSAHHAPSGRQTKAGQSGGWLALAAIAAILFLGVATAAWFQTSKSQVTAGQGVGGPFRMVDQDGRPVDQSVLRGHWSAVFFGYTFCPDICPATLQTLGQASRRLGPSAKDFQVVFVSVDPERDHPPQMKAYIEAQALPVRTIGLTGSTAEVAQIAKSYKVFYAKAGAGTAYSVDHSAAIYMMDPTGRFVSPLSGEMAPDKIADEIRKAQRGG